MRGVELAYPVAIKLAGRILGEGERGMLVSECPSCGQEMVFQGRSGVCLSERGCGFRRGDPLDYLAMAMGGYRDAVGKAFPNLDPPTSRQLAMEALGHRRILEYLMDLGERSRDGAVERVELQCLAEKAGILNPENPASIICTTSAETGELFSHLCAADIDCPPQMTGPCILVPYWSSPSSVSMLHVHANKGRQDFKIHVDRASWSWAGLDQFHLAPGSVLVHPTLQQLLAAERMAEGIMSPHRNTQVYVRSDGEGGGWSGDRLTFAGTAEEWMKCMPRWSHLPGFEEAGFLVDGCAADLGEAIAHLVAGAGDGEFSGGRVLAMLEAMYLSDKTAARLLETVFRQFGPRWQRDAEGILARRLLTRFGKTSLFSCPSGYESQVGGEATRLTNFTLTLEDVVGFSLSNELSYRGEVLVGATAFKVSLPGTSLDSPAVMEKELQSRQILGGGDESREELATIFHPKGFKDVCSHLKKSIPSLPRVRGTRQLGWTPRQDEYCTTGFSVRSGCVADAVYIPDETTSFHPFTPVGGGDAEVGTPPNLVLQGLVAAMAGNVMRAYLGLPYCPEPAHNGAGTRRALGILFAELGQTSPVRVTSILPRYLSAVSGHPVLCIGIAPAQAHKARINGVYLADKGANLEGTGDGEAAAAGRILLGIIREMCVRITAGEDVPYPERKSVALGGRAGVEGALMIRSLFGVEWSVSDGSYRYTDLLMAERRELLDAATAESDTHVVIPSGLIKGIASADDLMAELSLLCEELHATGEGIRLDRMSYSRIYENYHGAPPPLAIPGLPQ